MHAVLNLSAITRAGIKQPGTTAAHYIGTFELDKTPVHHSTAALHAASPTLSSAWWSFDAVMAHKADSHARRHLRKARIGNCMRSTYALCCSRARTLVILQHTLQMSGAAWLARGAAGTT